MSTCNVTIDGQEFPIKQAAEVVASHKSMMSIATRTTEQALEVMTKIKSKYFIDSNMFNLREQYDIVNIIYSHIVDDMKLYRGVGTVSITPGKAFENARAYLAAPIKKLELFLKFFESEEELSDSRNEDGSFIDPEVAKAFNDLKHIKSLEDARELKLQRENIVTPANWVKFKENVSIKFASKGIKVKNDGLEDISDSQEYYNAKIAEFLGEDEEENQDDVSEEQKGAKDWEDARQFSFNVRDTASSRIKMFNSNIYSGKINKYGAPIYMDEVQVFEDLLQIGAALPKVTLEALLEQLEIRSKYKPHLLEVKKKLLNLYVNEKNVSLINELLTVINKSYTEFVIVEWEKSNTGEITTKIFKSNRSNVITSVMTDWIESQKDSKIVTEINGEIGINTKVAEGLKITMAEARASKNENDIKQWIKTFFDTVNIDFTDQMIEKLFENTRSNKYKNSKGSPINLLNVDGVFGRILDAYTKTPLGKVDDLYEDVNNAMKEESSSFRSFAEIFIDLRTDIYQTTSFKDTEGKTRYSYSLKTFLENTKKKLNTSVDFLDTLSKRIFSKTSEALKSIKNGLGRITWNVFYMDGYKKSNDSDGVIRKNMSDKEQIMDAILKHQNQSKKSGYYNIFTLSDKTTTPLIEYTKFGLEVGTHISFVEKEFLNDPQVSFEDSLIFKPALEDEIYKLVEPEINRIIEYSKRVNSNNGKGDLNDEKFNDGYQLIYMFPFLNNVETDVKLFNIHKHMNEGKSLTNDEITYIKKLMSLNFKRQVAEIYSKWVKLGLVKIKQDEGGNNYISEIVSDKDYLNNKNNGVTGLSLERGEKALFAILDQELNHHRALLDTLQILGADPALDYKRPKGLKKSVSEMNSKERVSTVSTTWDEFSKRAARLIAPGTEGVWTWIDNDGVSVDRSNYRTLTIADIERNTELFKKVAATDAQEFITLEEHIDRMMSEGRIPLSIWESITNKIHLNRGKHYTLSAEEKKVVLQPTKPVHVSNQDNVTGFTSSHYIKSSTFPMIPEAIADSELDKLRQWMEINDVRSTNFKTAKKEGSPNQVLSMFDMDGNYIGPSIIQNGGYVSVDSDVVESSVQELSREGLRTQQEIPHQKVKITNVSQMNRLLFQGLEKVKNFMFAGGNYDGKELKRLKELVRTQQMLNKKVEVLEKMGVVQHPNGTVTIVDKKKLIDILREEAVTRGGYSENDIRSLMLDDKGEFSIPLYLLQSGEKFEGLINSLISKIVLLKNPGTSLVQVAGTPMKFKFSETSQELRNEIIWASNDDYDPSVGLKYMRKEEVNGKTIVKPAQIIMSQFIEDPETGELLNMEQFVTVINGRKMINPNQINHKLFNLIGARIPNQGHSSMLPVEVVGFLPKYMKNTVIVPDGITSQMGSDFDVDKLYAYFSQATFKYSNRVGEKLKEIRSELKTLRKNEKANEDKINSLIKERKSLLSHAIENVETEEYSFDKVGNEKDVKERLLRMSDEQLNEMYKDIHWSVLTHPEVFEKITKSIDFEDIPSEAALISKFTVKQDHWMPLSIYSQIDVYNDNKGGKSGVGIFASLLTFLGDHEDKELYLGRRVKIPEGGTEIKRFPILIGQDTGDNLHLDQISSTGLYTFVDKNGEIQNRTKADFLNMVFGESVDNAKNKLLNVFNWQPVMMKALGGYLALTSESNNLGSLSFATRLFPQQILRDYAFEVELIGDSTNEERVANPHDAVISNLTARYSSYISEEYKISYQDSLEQNGHPVLTPRELLNILEMKSEVDRINKSSVVSPEDQKVLDKYYTAQLTILNLFEKFHNAGLEINRVIKAIGVQTNSVGKDYFTLDDRLRSMKVLADSKVIMNTENIAGYPILSDEDRAVAFRSNGTELGTVIENSIFLAKEIYGKLIPVYQNQTFVSVVDRVFRNNGTNLDKIGSQKYIKWQRRVFNGLKSYLLTSPDLGIFVGDAKSERNRLLRSTLNNDSLAKRYRELKIKYPELEVNDMFKHLTTKFGTKIGEPATLGYRNAFDTDLDETKSSAGFLEMLTSDNKEISDFARDLVVYNYVVGGLRSASTFLKQIPIEYLSSDERFASSLKQLENVSDEHVTIYYKQFIQNNPTMAFRLDDKSFQKLGENSSTKEFVILDVDGSNEAIIEKLRIKKTVEEIKTSGENPVKYPDFISVFFMDIKKTVLYEKVGGIDSARYEKINTLGSSKQAVVEYNYGKSSPVSMFVDNNLSKDVDRIGVTNNNNAQTIDIYYGPKNSESTDPHRQLSNLAFRPFIYDSREYYSVEHAYQSLKSGVFDQNTYNKYPKSAGVKIAGLAAKTENNYNLTLMKDIMLQSFQQNIEAKELLLSTNNALLTHSKEKSEWKTWFPEMLTDVRKQLQPTQDRELTIDDIKNVNDPNPGDEPGDMNYSDEQLEAMYGGFDENSLDADTLNSLDDDSKEPSDTLLNKLEQSLKDGINLDKLGELMDSKSEDDMFAAMEDAYNQETLVPTEPIIIVSPPGEPVVKLTESEVLKSIYGIVPENNNKFTIDGMLKRITKNDNAFPFQKKLAEILLKSSKQGFHNKDVVIDNKAPEKGKAGYNGFYSPQTGNVHINNETLLAFKDSFSVNKITNLILHESLHAYLLELVHKFTINPKDPSLTAHERMFLNRLDRLFKDTQDYVLNSKDSQYFTSMLNEFDSGNLPAMSQESVSKYYGLFNLNEFTSMAMTDVGFQTFLNSIQSKNKDNKTYWDKLVELISDLIADLGQMIGQPVIKNSTLEQTVSSIVGLINSYSPSSEIRSMNLPAFSVSSVSNIDNSLTLENQCKL